LDLRYRTIFYRALGRLFLAYQIEDEEQFVTFVSPLTGNYVCSDLLLVPIESRSLATFQKAASMMSGNSQVVNEDHLKV